MGNRFAATTVWRNRRMVNYFLFWGVRFINLKSRVIGLDTKKEIFHLIHFQMPSLLGLDQAEAKN